MQQRINYTQVAPDGYKAMAGLEQYSRRSGLESSLLELVKTRASQIHGYAFCLGMHQGCPPRR
jgi:alkylhydroperoxidase family enzyme